MNYKDFFQKWKDYVIYHSDDVKYDGCCQSVIMPCGNIRVEYWRFENGREVVFFDKLIPNPYKKFPVWVEHSDFGPSKVTSGGEFRYKICGEEITPECFHQRMIDRIINEILDDEKAD